MLHLKVNGQYHELDIDPDTPLLWALLDHLHLFGTKYGCGIGLCGTCTVHIDDRAVRACMVTAGAVTGKTSPPSRALRRTASRCSRPGKRSRCRSAATANRA